MAQSPGFAFTDILPLGDDDTTEYRLLTTDGVEQIDLGGQPFLRVSNDAIRRLSAEAISDISHLLASSHLQQLRDYPRRS